MIVKWNYEDIRECVYVTLVNQDHDAYFLQDHPSVPWLDLAVVFYIKPCQQQDIYAWITNKNLEEWQVEVTEMFCAAFKNTQRDYPTKITSLNDEIIKLNEMIGIEGTGEEMFEKSKDLKVLTNLYGSMGAVCMLYNNVLADYADKIDGDILIFPSSKHEVILLDDKNYKEYDEYRIIVQMINENEVLPEDFLSNNLYIYRRLDGKVHLLLKDETSDGLEETKPRE